MSKVVTGIGVIFTLYGLGLNMISNLNLGVLLTLALGIFILLIGLFWKRIGKLTSRGIGKILRNAVIVLLCLEFALVGFLAFYSQSDNVDYAEDAVVVLGAGIRGDRVMIPLKLRLEKAIEYHEKNPEALIVVTGGQGFQETVTEAYAMEKYLLEHGVEPSVIVKEELAASTNENMRFSREILDEKFGTEEYEIVVITNNFHIYRAVSIAKAEGFTEISHLHAGLQWYNLVPCYLRESLAVLKMWVFD